MVFHEKIITVPIKKYMNEKYRYANFNGKTTIQKKLSDASA